MSKGTIKKNTLFNIVKSACSIIFPLITFPYISRTLMAEGVGRINFGNSIVSYFLLISSLGVSTYALKQCAGNRRDREALSTEASEIFSINLVSTIISYVILAFVLIFCKSLENYRLLIIIQSTVILFTTLGADWLNSAMEDFKFITLRSAGFQVLSLILMFIFVHKPEDYLKYALITVLAGSGANIVNVFYRRKYCDIRFLLKMNVKKHLPPIMLFFSMIIAQQIYVNSDITLLGLYKGDFEVGLYSTSVKIYTIANTMIASVSSVVWPQIAEAYKNKRQGDVNRLAKYSLGFIVTFGLPAIVGINVVARELILLIAGEEYINAAVSLHILTAALFFSLIGGWMGSTNFLPNGREKICLLSSCSSAIVNIVLNFFLIPLWGLNAAALTTAISEFVALFILVASYDRKMKIDGLPEMILKPAAGCIAIGVVSFVVRSFAGGYIMVFSFTVLFSLAAYFLVLLLLKDCFLMEYIKPVVDRIKEN